MFKKLFTTHPKSLGETYWQHLWSALRYCGTLLAAFVVCLLHAVLPFLFENTGGNLINKLATSVSKRTKRKCGCSNNKPVKTESWDVK